MFDQIIHLMERTSSIPAELKQVLREYIGFITAIPGHFLLKPKQQSDRVYLVISGLLRCYKEEDGKERTIWFRTDAQAAFLAPNFCNRQPAQEEYIVAIEQTRLAFITFEHREELRRRFVEFACIDAHFTEECLADHLHHSSICRLNAEQRYNWFLEFYHHLLPRVPLRHIASFLGMTEETLSRTRASILRRTKSSEKSAD